MEYDNRGYGGDLATGRITPQNWEKAVQKVSALRVWLKNDSVDSDRVVRLIEESKKYLDQIIDL